MQLMSIKTGLLCVLLLSPQMLTRSYYFDPLLSKKRSRATGNLQTKDGHSRPIWEATLLLQIFFCFFWHKKILSAKTR